MRLRVAGSRALAAACVVACVVLLLAPSQPLLAQAANPNQVAILRWYRANQAAEVFAGNGPHHLAFDGGSMWVGNHVDQTVSKLRASDGASLGTFPVASPVGVAFDGANVWVTNNSGITVSKR